tara:strand:+ start:219 stop:395 length:177 start_codon:yes stop_codon:yes gene_type:complete
MRLLLNSDGGWSALPLLETGILLVDHEPLSLADHDLAVLGATFDAASNLHGWFLLFRG